MSTGSKEAGEGWKDRMQTTKRRKPPDTFIFHTTLSGPVGACGFVTTLPFSNTHVCTDTEQRISRLLHLAYCSYVCPVPTEQSPKTVAERKEKIFTQNFHGERATERERENLNYLEVAVKQHVFNEYYFYLTVALKFKIICSSQTQKFARKFTTFAIL